MNLLEHDFTPACGSSCGACGGGADSCGAGADDGGGDGDGGAGRSDAGGDWRSVPFVHYCLPRKKAPQPRSRSPLDLIPNPSQSWTPTGGVVGALAPGFPSHRLRPAGCLLRAIRMWSIPCQRKIWFSVKCKWFWLRCWMMGWYWRKHLALGFYRRKKIKYKVFKINSMSKNQHLKK